MAYYKAISLLDLNITKPDLIKHEIDYFDKKKDTMSKSDYLRYVSEAEVILNKLKEELSNLKCQRDVAEAELMFFGDTSELTSIIDNLNSLLMLLEKVLIKSINLLLQVFKESNVNLNNRHVIQTVVLETQEKRAKIFTDLYTDRHSDLSSIRIFNDNLKKILMKRLKSLTS